MDVDEVSYDILEWFPILYCQNVFKYLSGKDVIQASAVSKQWYKFTGESPQVNKLKILISRKTLKRKLTRGAVNVAKNSGRKYQNVEFRKIELEASRQLFPILAARAGSWKFVAFKSCAISDQGIWNELLRIIEPSVAEILIDLKRCPEDQVDPRWTFPCLKSLEVITRIANFFKYFSRCTTLIRLVMPPEMAPTQIEAMHWDVITLFRNNRNLKEISGHVTAFIERPFEFKLQKLYIKRRFVEHADAPYDENLREFLSGQVQTVKSLEVDINISRATMMMILKSMSKLTSLKVDLSKIGEAINEGQAYPVNITISSLDLSYVVHAALQTTFHNLIRALPNLKHFKVHELKDSDFYFLSREVPSLESLEVREFNVSHLPEGDIFPALKVFSAEIFNYDLPVPTGNGNFAALLTREVSKYYQWLQKSTMPDAYPISN